MYKREEPRSYYEEESQYESKQRLEEDEGQTYHRPGYSPRVHSSDFNDDSSIFDACLGSPEVRAETQKELMGDLKEGYTFVKQTIPGFFTPFGKKPAFQETFGLNTKKEVALVATSPITIPVSLTLGAGLAAATAAVATIAALGGLLTAAGAGLHSLRAGKEDARETAKNALMFSAKAGITAAISTLAAVAAAVLAAVSAPIALLYLLTRTGATAVGKIAECCADDTETSYRFASMQ
ncbi:Uncharacterised protein [Legionella steigerwaltii]|uniref:Transmembrane protein n=1 Tax=Legionella steigerwaltii TaxID=460 RepID=A0A378LC30_9GAMM|nr:hypothetical protein [Legionella steigerwaltii]KTD79530.1 hypothetical protein Lstg_0746 [Legionella steigerwaltii]STY24585.1 Uncharacterised protein [Legionella steigerwaltii]